MMLNYEMFYSKDIRYQVEHQIKYIFNLSTLANHVSLSMLYMLTIVSS